MNIKEEILREHSKAQCLRIAHYIGDDKQRFDELMYLFLNSSVTRNTVRVLRYLDKIPESSIGLAASICFNYLTTPSVPIAVRVFSMHILYKFLKLKS